MAYKGASGDLVWKMWGTLCGRVNAGRHGRWYQGLGSEWHPTLVGRSVTLGVFSLGVGGCEATNGPRSLSQEGQKDQG